ncbi:hypothetical protein [Croceicoccus bisphenolivorans]|uniref:hypothetical protein n=1 Tax=Croceicoccus bisphenolivorans TaxID=1783232 RepID=UPI00082C6998|nr:hypothetical protein [Croceicoccus bisphenolivorans]
MFADQSPAAKGARIARRSAPERIEAALRALASGHGQIIVHREIPWASITFAGARHTLSMSFSGMTAVEAGERMIAQLPDHEFVIPGQLVADAQVLAVDHAMLPEPVMRVEVELLLLEES